jgi:hypothetical protein
VSLSFSEKADEANLPSQLNLATVGKNWQKRGQNSRERLYGSES